MTQPRITPTRTTGQSPKTEPPEPAPTPVEVVEGRVRRVEEDLLQLLVRVSETFEAFDNEVNSLYEIGITTHAAIKRMHEVLEALIEDPLNPTASANKARDLLKAPLDLGGGMEDDGNDPEPAGDGVVPEPEGDQAGNP